MSHFILREVPFLEVELFFPSIEFFFFGDFLGEVFEAASVRLLSVAFRTSAGSYGFLWIGGFLLLIPWERYTLASSSVTCSEVNLFLWDCFGIFFFSLFFCFLVFVFWFFFFYIQIRGTHSDKAKLEQRAFFSLVWLLRE